MVFCFFVEDFGIYRFDVYDFFFGVYKIVKMYLRDVGIWLFYCYVGFYIEGGMESIYIVIEWKGKSY